MSVLGRVAGVVAASAILLAAGAAAQPGTRTACQALADLRVEGARITAAERVAPGWKFPNSAFNAFARPKPEAQITFCRVALTIEREIKVEVWLPDIWNQRFEAVGNGGYTGAINYPAMTQAIGAGFATASTDTGHETPANFFDAGWAAGHPDRVENFAHRAHHLMAVAAKKIVTTYYETAPKKSYFTGCSSGGWQGLSEAQRYPEDYDGIVAGAPATNFVRLQSSGLVQAWLARRDPRSAIPVAKMGVVARAMVAQCDAADGVSDGIITDPRQCHFDFSRLLCQAGDRPDCLTRAQVAYARHLYGPQTTPHGLRLYPGQPLGVASLGPHGYLPGHDLTKNSLMLAALPHRPAWTQTNFNPDRDIPAMDRQLGPMLNAMNPDLAAFKARGGKLIVYHGWADNVLSPYNTLDYFHAVQARVPGSESFVRLYMIPSMGHCGGGAGPNAFDSSSAIVNWVENATAPEELIGYHVGPDGDIGMTRPLCPEPRVAVYKGTGPTDEASSFVCRVPR